MEYYAAYLLEFSLSVDNIFVFVIVFSELHIPAENQRRVLAWGVAGALVFRAVMIAAGITLIQRKMIGSEWIHVSPGVSVGIIGLVLGVTMAVSMRPRRISETVPR